MIYQNALKGYTSDSVTYPRSQIDQTMHGNVRCESVIRSGMDKRKLTEKHPCSGGENSQEKKSRRLH